MVWLLTSRSHCNEGNYGKVRWGHEGLWNLTYLLRADNTERQSPNYSRNALIGEETWSFITSERRLKEKKKKKEHFLPE